MKRTDAVVAGTLILLASFVGRELARARMSHPVATTSFGTSAGTEVAKSPVVRRPARVPTSDAAIDRSESRRKLAEHSSGTYVHEILAAHDSSIARWPDRRGTPLHVWIQSASNLTDWNPVNVALVREAFVTWTDAGVPLNFSFVLDSASADVHVNWLDHFADRISGKTLWTHDDRWWIVDGDILLALHSRAGETLDSAAIRAIALHEVGHLVGLDHTTDTTSIMAPRVQTRELSRADRATVQLIYSLTPGPVRGRRDLPAQRQR